MPFTSAFKESCETEGKGAIIYGGSFSFKISGLLNLLLTTPNVCNDRESNKNMIDVIETYTYILTCICVYTHAVCFGYKNISTEVSSLTYRFSNSPVFGSLFGACHP